MTMQRRQRTHGLLGTAAAAVLLAMTLGLAGCGSDGDDGAAGPPGPPGPPGPIAPPELADTTALKIDITDVTISSPPVVSFRVTNQDGFGFPSLQQGNVAFTFAKLKPRAVGAGHDWQSYINRTDPGPATVGPGGAAVLPLAQTIQATSEGNGTLENLGGGDYRYTFRNDVTNVTTPMPVAWEPNLTHRVAMQLSNPLASALGRPINAWKDFVPANPAAQPTASREIAATATCNSCHDVLAIHGGGRGEVQYCVTCHNPGTTDANSGESLDMKVMVHKIHRGRFLPRIGAGAEYAIWGFGGSKHDYSDVDYPYEKLVQGNNQRTMACTKCHTAEEPRLHSGTVQTNDGNLWKTAGHSTVAACGSCHEDVPGIGPAGANWINNAKFNHTTIAANLGAGTLPSMCNTCHDVGDTHRLQTYEKASRIAVQFDGNPVLDPVANTLTARFRLVDTLNNNATLVHGTTYNAAGLSGPVLYGPDLVRTIIGWRTDEFRTYDASNNLNSEGQAIRFTTLPAGAVDALVDGYYQAVYPLPSARVAEMVAAGGSGLLGIKNGVSIDGVNLRFSDGDVAFAITDAVPQMRRAAATITECKTCHLSIAFHGGGREGNLQVCATCHNSNFFQTGSPAGRGFPEGYARNSGLMNMVHAIHANSGHRNPARLAAGGATEAQIEAKHVNYPGLIQNCSQCHVPGGNELPLIEAATGISVGVQPGGTLTDASTHLKATATYSACASCHDSNAAKGHMLSMGGADGLGFDGTGTNLNWSFDMPDATGESCAVCHGPGRQSDVVEVHKW
jgi:OmcA/MtrC family decaheme c-type cytochrome